MRFDHQTQGKSEQHRFTEDGVLIAANYFQSKKRNASRLVILAPGFAKTKDGYPMKEICQDLIRYGDVLCLDFRGVGKSEGRYTFGANEYKDLKPFLEWGKKNYRQNVLVGLSLGAYHAFRAAHAWPELVNQVLLVSCPSQLEDVLTTLGPLRQGWAIVSDGKALRKRLTIQANPFFRWGNPFSSKPKAEWLAPGLRVPVSFLVGGKDRLVLKSLSRKIYDQVPNRKSWTEVAGGNHAEFLYIENRAAFMSWLKRSLK
jgi:pimeloyl-ACP methyl ester carboxylesterase